MGLDMYAYTRKTVPEKSVDFSDAETDEELFYWRKHPNLHGWMETLYRKKGGTAESFNCVNLELDEADIDELEKAVNGQKLPETTGFFFGQSDPEDKLRDRAFITAARAALKSGLFVYYTSWW